MQRRFILTGALIGAALLLLLARYLLSHADTRNPNASVAVDPRLPVRVTVVQPRPLSDNIITTGTVLADEEVELRSEISGKITGIFFREGSRVRAGDLLVKINDAELRAQLMRAEYQVKLAEDKEYRHRMLLKTEGISQQEYDVALNELNVRKAEAALIRAQIEKTEIRSPFDGMIGLRHVSDGSYITPATPIAVLQRNDPIKIDFAIPERHAAVVRTGDRIKFSLQGSSKIHIGTIYALESRIDPTTRTFRLRAIAPNKEGAILPGAFALIDLVLQEIDNALLVPTQALIPHLTGQKLLVLRNGVVEDRFVETGIRTETHVQITRGIASGDTVLTTGLLHVRAGMPVRVSDVH